MSGDLTMHKRTLEPIKTLVYGLRRYDVDRCAALITSSGMDVTKVEGFMSHKSKIYLADVHDHMDYVISSMDMFSSIAENLINYTFNVRGFTLFLASECWFLRISLRHIRWMKLCEFLASPCS